MPVYAALAPECDGACIPAPTARGTLRLPSRPIFFRPGTVEQLVLGLLVLVSWVPLADPEYEIEKSAQEKKVE